MESNNKNKKNTVWIILTCVFALTTLVLGMALYRSQSDRKLLESQLAGAQDVVAVTMDQQQQLAGADNLQEIRIMNGILQQQDKHQQWGRCGTGRRSAAGGSGTGRKKQDAGTDHTEPGSSAEWNHQCRTDFSADG